MAAIKLVVFDMAGTTVKDKKEVEHCFAASCEATGLEVSEARIQALQGYAKREVFKLLWSEKLGEGNPSLEEHIDFSYHTFREILETHYQENDIFTTDFCLETFEILKENNIKIALNTGFYRKVANIILEKLGWLNGLNDDFIKIGGSSPIDISLTPTEVEKGRPAPDMIFAAMRHLHIHSAKEVIKVGDTPVDLEEGYNAGCFKSLAVTNGTHTAAQLAKYQNDGLLSNLSELAGFLNLDQQKDKKRFFTF